MYRIKIYFVIANRTLDFCSQVTYTIEDDSDSDICIIQEQIKVRIV